MPTFTRRTQLVFSGRFTLQEDPDYEAAETEDSSTTGDSGSDEGTEADDGTNVQPSAATLQLRYLSFSLNQNILVTVPMTIDNANPAGPKWSATWDSTDAAPGRVEWVVFSTGAVQAATQGSFQLLGNNANTGNLIDAFTLTGSNG